MEIIKIPHLRLTELQTLTECTINICLNLLGIERFLMIVVSNFKVFKEAMLKEQASAEDKYTVYKKLDKLVSGLLKDTNAELLFPHTDAKIISTLNNLSKIINKYGIKINRLPFNEGALAIDNMIIEIAQIDLAPLEALNLERWMPLINSVNTEFKAVSKEDVIDTAYNLSIELASNLAPELTDTLDGLYTMLFAMLKLSPTSEMETAYEELEILVNSMK